MMYSVLPIWTVGHVNFTFCSIASDSVSQGHILQDEDSLLSNPASYSHPTDEEAELLRVLEEVSCSSSSSAEESEEEEEEEEISESGVGRSLSLGCGWKGF